MSKKKTGVVTLKVNLSKLDQSDESMPIHEALGITEKEAMYAIEYMEKNRTKTFSGDIITVLTSDELSEHQKLALLTYIGYTKR